MSRRSALLLFFGLAAASIGPTPVWAQEESKIQVSLDSLGASGAGSMRSKMMDTGTSVTASMQVKVQHLAPNLEHIVMGDGIEVARFTTNAAGNGGVSVDLLATGGGTTPSFDPRGKFVTVNDGVADVLGAWVYADPADDPRRAKVKELTMLAPVAVPEPVGSASARYDLLPNGKSRLSVTLQGVPVGDYEIAIDGVLVGSVTTNSGGNARIRFDTNHPTGNGVGNGNGKVKGNGKGNGNGHGNSGGPPHNQKRGLDFDPRSKQIDILQGAVAVFSGPMLAQIASLGLCTEVSTVTAMTLDPAQSSGAGSVTTGIEESCDLVFEVDVSGLATGSYDLVVDAVLVGSIAVADDGAGNVVGSILFDQTPDSGENVLAFAFAPGSVVEVNQGATPLLSATLP